MPSTPSLTSVVVPVYDEAESIGPCLRGIAGALGPDPHEIIVVHDRDEDTTLPAIAALDPPVENVRLLKNDLGRGVAHALRAAFAAARGDVVVTTMADLSDDPSDIPVLAEKIRWGGAAVVSGSRYMRGGHQQGGPLIKRTLSRLAGLSLHWLGGLPTHDPTTNFRAYRRDFLESVEVESRLGFAVALELTVKAHLAGHAVAEAPTTWRDRTSGESGFRIGKWLPEYLRWYFRGMWGEPGRSFTGGLPAVVFVVLCVLLALALARFPDTVASDGLDPSWQQALSYGAVQGWQFGEDIVFTYGPLGWTTLQTYQRELFSCRVLVEILVKLLVAVWVVRAAFGERGRLPGAVLVTAAAVFLNEETLFPFVALLIGGRLCAERRLPPWRAAGGVAFLAFISLIKFTFLACAVGVVALAAVEAIRRRRSVGSSMGLVATYVLAFLALWVAAGQRPGNLAAFLAGSFRMAAGYAEAMSLSARPARDVSIGVVLLGIWAAAGIAGLLRRPVPVPRIAPVLMTAGVVAILWKHGFVRHDGHVLGFFQACVVLPLLGWSSDTGDDGPWRGRLRRALLVGAIFVAGGMALEIGSDVGRGPLGAVGRMAARMGENTGLLVRPGHARVRLERLRRDEAASHALPGIRRVVGDRTVDLVGGWEQGVLLLNDLDYRPRPVLQSYAAFTPRLLERNAEHLRSDDAPEFVLLRLAGIDRRYPGMEDGLALLQLLRRYRPVLEESTYSLLRRTGPADPSTRRGLLLLEKDLRWGERLDLTDHGDRRLVVRLDVRPSRAGKLRQLALRSPAVWMDVESAGKEVRYRIVPGMCREGFLLQPLLRNRAGFLSAYESPGTWSERDRVDGLAVQLDGPEHERYFEPEVRVRVYEMPR